MENSGELKELETFIENEGMYTSMRKGEGGNDELICKSTASGGNSFWVLYSKKHEKWYLVTWAPIYYLFASNDKNAIFSTVLEILHFQDRILWKLPEIILQKHAIIQIEKPVDIY